ncbi:hypothetical protein [Vibrio chagasii]|uniref:hypothetical protein n=1 Tax=Vibrio chagasii TaxID=170679 RepID=UPI003DA159E3
MKKLMIAVAVAGVMFSVNSFAFGGPGGNTVDVAFKEATFGNATNDLLASAGKSDKAVIYMSGDIPQRCVLNMKSAQGGGFVDGHISLSNMLDTSKNKIGGVTKQKVATLRAWCNYGKSMEVSMTATPFKSRIFSNEHINYSLQANKTEVLDTATASPGIWPTVSGKFDVDWSGKHQVKEIAQIPLTIKTEGAALARAGKYMSVVGVKLEAKTCHRRCF